MRARFDAERGCAPAKALRLLREGQDELFAYTHPDPYCNPVMPGGSKFMRNPPLPMEVCFPDGDLPAAQQSSCLVSHTSCLTTMNFSHGSAPEASMIQLVDDSWFGNISDLYTEDGTGCGRMRWTSHKWSNYHVYWDGQKWKATGFDGHLGFGDMPGPDSNNTGTTSTVRVKVIKAPAGKRTQKIHAPAPVDYVPPTKKARTNDDMSIAIESTSGSKTSKVKSDRGWIQFLYNIDDDHQNMGRLQWESDGCIRGHMGADVSSDQKGNWTGRVHLATDRSFTLSSGGADKGYITGNLPTKEDCEETTTQFEFPCDVNIPGSHGLKGRVTFIVFKAKIHEEERIRIITESDMDNSKNQFNRKIQQSDDK